MAEMMLSAQDMAAYIDYIKAKRENEDRIKREYTLRNDTSFANRASNEMLDKPPITLKEKYSNIAPQPEQPAEPLSGDDIRTQFKNKMLSGLGSTTKEVPGTVLDDYDTPLQIQTQGRLLGNDPRTLGFKPTQTMGLSTPTLAKDSPLSLKSGQDVENLQAPVDRAKQFDTAQTALSGIQDEKMRGDLLKNLGENRSRETAQQAGEMLSDKMPEGQGSDFARVAARTVGGLGSSQGVEDVAKNTVAQMGEQKQQAGFNADTAKNKSQYDIDLENLKARHDKELEDLKIQGRKALKGSGNQIGTDEEGNPIYGPDKNDFSQEQQLRTQLSSRSKDFATMKDAYSRIKEVSTGGSMSDISLIYQYMKMNDPGSTVREGEFATAQNAASVPDRIRNMYNKIAKGERLNSDQRLEIVNNSKRFYDSAARIQDVLNNEYAQIAKDYNLKPERVIGGFSTKLPNEKISEAPKVINGYTVKKVSGATPKRKIKIEAIK
jgi:hypothetical protein